MECSQELKELLKTLYGLSSSESEVLTYLCNGEEARISEIAEELERDRSTVQRYISKLRAAGLVNRRSQTTEKGKGRFFIYYLDKEDMKKKVEERLEEWKEEKEREIEKL